MKKIQILLTTFFLIITGHSFAQTSSTYQNINSLTVNNDDIRINDFQSENINTTKGLIYNVNFSLNINEGKNFKDVLAAFIKMDESPGDNKILISKYVRVQINTDVPKINEQWVYENLIIDEIILPVLDASSNRQNAKIIIKFHTSIAAVAYNVKNELKLASLFPEVIASLTSNFSVALEKLPCKYISKVSAINIAKSASKILTLTIAARDIAAWNASFTANPGKQYKAGIINYYAPNLKEVLFAVNLLKVKIVSISNLPATSNQLQQYEIVLSFEREEV